jgi:hypothetical protein
MEKKDRMIYVQGWAATRITNSHAMNTLDAQSIHIVATREEAKYLADKFKYDVYEIEATIKFKEPTND